jgi:hypothetical protein
MESKIPTQKSSTNLRRSYVAMPPPTQPAALIWVRLALFGIVETTYDSDICRLNLGI